MVPETFGACPSKSKAQVGSNKTQTISVSGISSYSQSLSTISMLHISIRYRKFVNDQYIIIIIIIIIILFI